MASTDSSITTAQILADILARKTSRNPSYSLRAFARDLGVSHTYLSLVMNGKKPLSMRKVIHFSQILEMDDLSSRAFLEAGSKEARGRAFEKAATPTRGKGRKGLPKLDYFEIEADRFRALSDWYHLPLLDLTMTDGFRNNPAWIAKRLHISAVQVKDGIERLKRLGLLDEKDGRLVKTNARLVVKGTPDKAIRDFHSQMISKALAELEHGDPQRVHARDITGVTIPMDPALIPEAKRRIAAFRRSLWRFLSSGEQKELYQLNIQLVPLTLAEPSRKGAVLKKGRVAK